MRSILKYLAEVDIPVLTDARVKLISPMKIAQALSKIKSPTKEQPTAVVGSRG